MTDITSDDPLLDRFSDLLVPGRRAPLNRPEEPSIPLSEVWEDKPLKYMFGGIEREFFTISHLAKALDRSVVTIRSWEAKGMMPPTPYRSPKPQGATLPGKPSKGKRLWTREQIQGILRIAAEERVILNGKPPTKNFSDRVLNLYRQLLGDSQT